MALSDDDATKRTNAVEAVNGALAEVEIARKSLLEANERHTKAVNDAKSALGTAAAKLRQAEYGYSAARDRLLRLLPPVDGPLNEEARGDGEVQQEGRA